MRIKIDRMSHGLSLVESNFFWIRMQNSSDNQVEPMATPYLMKIAFWAFKF